jgi:hypothetical protein
VNEAGFLNFKARAGEGKACVVNVAPLKNMAANLNDVRVSVVQKSSK